MRRALLAGVMICLAVPATAQIQDVHVIRLIDARVVPRGVLRVGFEPHLINYNQRFPFDTPGISDDTAVPLGADLTADTAGANLFPAVAPAERAVRQIAGDPTYRINIGAFDTQRDADIRRFPFTVAVGVSNRLTVTAKIPIVTVRSQVEFTTDGIDANVGWNQAIAELGGSANASEAAALLDQLGSAIGDLESQISGGGFGCPGGAGCAQVLAALDRATNLRDNLQTLTGIGSNLEPAPPFAPLATSPAGGAITAEITSVAAQLQGLGTSPVTATLPLPEGRLAETDVDRLLTTPGLGYEAFALDFARNTRFGDIELGLQYGLLQGARARALVFTTFRLPTGTRDRANHFVDLGTGDRQTDVEVGLEAAFEPAAAGIAFGVSYTLQLSDQLPRRIGPPDSILLPLNTEALVNRNLGDVFRAHVYPYLRLSDGFSAYASLNYFAKGRDEFTDLSGASLAVLERETKMNALSLGAGIAYRMDRTAQGRTLPVEAGIGYSATFSGSGGLTPKANELALYLRLFYNVFGQALEDDGQ